MEKTWFYEKLLLEVVIVKDNMSIKISFMHYMKWTRVTLPVVFEEFEVVYLFIYFSDNFFFSLSLSIGKRSTLPKIWLRLQPRTPLAPPAMPRFYF